MEKVFSISIQDFSLIISEGWQVGYTKEMKRQVGFQLPRASFFRSKAGVNIMRPESDQEAFEKFVLKRIKSDPKYFLLSLRKFYRYLRKLENLKKETKRDWNYCQRLFRINSKIIPGYVLVYWSLSRPQLRRYINFKEAEKARVKSEGFYDKIDKIFKEMFIEKLGRNEQFRDYFRVIKFAEFKNLLLKNKLPDLAELKKRKINYFFFQDAFLAGKLDLNKILKQYNFKYQISRIPKRNILYGQAAYPGKARGRIKVINGKDDLNKIKEGDILVAASTSPDFIPAIKLSVAIVSDYGGIVCHAAITAREFKIPCIVGTKIATKVLKDGDLVEVDADKGIVRIINKK